MSYRVPNWDEGTVSWKCTERAGDWRIIRGCSLQQNRNICKHYADKAQDLLTELEQLFARYHASEALKVKEGIKPVPDFHSVRHCALSPEQNLAINQLCPIIAMIKTKARPKESL